MGSDTQNPFKNDFIFCGNREININGRRFQVEKRHGGTTRGHDNDCSSSSPSSTLRKSIRDPLSSGMVSLQRVNDAFLVDGGRYSRVNRLHVEGVQHIDRFLYFLEGFYALENLEN